MAEHDLAKEIARKTPLGDERGTGLPGREGPANEIAEMSEKDTTVTIKDDSKLAPGDVVSGLESSELVEIQRVAPFGGKTLVEGVGLQSRRMVKRPLAAEELAALVKVRGQQHTFDGDPPVRCALLLKSPFFSRT